MLAACFLINGLFEFFGRQFLAYLKCQFGDTKLRYRSLMKSAVQQATYIFCLANSLLKRGTVLKNNYHAG